MLKWPTKPADTDDELWYIAVSNTEKQIFDRLTLKERIAYKTPFMGKGMREKLSATLASFAPRTYEKFYRAHGEANSVIDEFLWAARNASPARRAALRKFAEHGHAGTEIAAGAGVGFGIGALIDGC